MAPVLRSAPPTKSSASSTLPVHDGIHGIQGPITFQRWMRETTLDGGIDGIKVAGYGSYGVVFKQEESISLTQKAVKFIPLLSKARRHARKESGGTEDEEVHKEVQISRALVELKQFATMQSAWVVLGSLPRRYKLPLQVWCDAGRSQQGDRHERSLCLRRTARWVVMVFNFAGSSVPALISPSDGTAILYQVIRGLADAEAQLEFEHRDLSLANICIDRLPAASPGHTKLVVTMIDFGLARCTFREQVYFTDISLLELPAGSTHERVANAFKERHENKWEVFEPRTNVLWINTLAAEITSRLDTSHELKHSHAIWLIRHVRALCQSARGSKDIAKGIGLV